MSDRREYMKFYMRERRAAQRAARLAAESEDTEPDSQESTEGGGWLFWLVIGGFVVALIAGSIGAARQPPTEMGNPARQ